MIQRQVEYGQVFEFGPPVLKLFVFLAVCVKKATCVHCPIEVAGMTGDCFGDVAVLDSQIGLQNLSALLGSRPSIRTNMLRCVIGKFRIELLS